ncbi:MAG: hypothetical protein WCK62_04430 [Actinomycetes bacterium]
MRNRSSLSHPKIATILAATLIGAAMVGLSGPATASEHREAPLNLASLQASGVRSFGAPVLGAAQPASSVSQGVSPAMANDDQMAEPAWQGSFATPSGRATVTNPILYHTGGALYAGNVAIYPVWVGTWSATRKTLWNKVLSNLVTALGTATSNTATANQVFATNQTYFTSRALVAPTLLWPQATTPTASISATGNVTDAQVAGYLSTALQQNLVPSPTTSNGNQPIYLYLGANNTYLSSGFGTKYCGWHSWGTIGTTKITYIAIQDFTSNYLSACSAQTKASPNGDLYVDAMASVLVHEIDETLTDPFLNAWYDAKGAENADKCAWTFGTTTSLSGYSYNYTAGSLKYLIQRNWLSNNVAKADGTSCVLASAS